MCMYIYSHVYEPILTVKETRIRGTYKLTDLYTYIYHITSMRTES